jgi:hypothetical protein
MLNPRKMETNQEGMEQAGKPLKMTKNLMVPSRKSRYAQMVITG